MSSTPEAAPDEAVVEVFADITCPFTHVGLKRVIAHVEELADPPTVRVRAWPLEWVNGSGLEADAVQLKATLLTDQLGVDDFHGFNSKCWPSSTLHALELSAVAYESGPAVGLAVSLDVRAALFEQGLDVGDRNVLADIAER
nr:disulfide bond formation protein DsbA [Ilumatobacter sp.]